MAIQFKVNDGHLVAYLEGRVDSLNAKDVQDEMLSIVNDNQHESFEIDASKLEFISSAGLRMVLTLAKQDKNMRLTNVKRDVYDVFEMTGFTAMMNISKEFRSISVDGCEVIGQGANGKVYKVGDDIIVKVYMNSDALPDIENERKLAQKAFMLGIPTAIPYDIVKVGDKFGSVFELLNADSFAKIVAKDSENFDKYIKMSADVLRDIHKMTLPDGTLPKIKDRVLKRARYLEGRIPEEVYNKVINLVESIPNRDTVLHGDYHIKNIMLQNGEVLLIDMDTLSQGDIVFEFANMYTGYIGYGELDPKNIEDFLGIPITLAGKIFHDTVASYFNNYDANFLTDVLKKCALLSSIRLYKRMEESEEEYFHSQAEHFKQNIIRLTNQLDCLTIKGE